MGSAMEGLGCCSKAGEKFYHVTPTLNGFTFVSLSPASSEVFTLRPLIICVAVVAPANMLDRETGKCRFLILMRRLR